MSVEIFRGILAPFNRAGEYKSDEARVSFTVKLFGVSLHISQSEFRHKGQSFEG